MTISLRLDDTLAEQLEAVALHKGVSKSELIRECLADFLARQQQPSAWELGKDLFGNVGSGKGDLARNSKQIAKEKVNATGRGRR